MLTILPGCPGNLFVLCPIVPGISTQYYVARSLSNNIDTAENIVANGTLVQDWTAKSVTLSVTGLTAGTTYFFNVLVRDVALNKAVYTMIEKKTADKTPPVTGNRCVWFGVPSWHLQSFS